ncbi:sugar phosphate nucleotidyltransferase, partial [Burkholderia thailandensis]|uniref:sugar phosphate nucleotidyltransferase n=1 Tax=Burkholderia thailandensis TaxID=57975 RepID=UPI00217E0F32
WRTVAGTPWTAGVAPMRRDPAIAMAMAHHPALRESPDALLLVLPADHGIDNETAFVDVVRTAASIASDAHLVTFGVTPTQEHTGYGYIRRGEPFAGDTRVYRVDSFFEKPDAPSAERFISDGGY